VVAKPAVVLVALPAVDAARVKASRSLMMGYKSFMIEIGLYGNTMDYDYKAYSILATNGTWYKNVWELVHYFKISLAFQSEYHLGPV